MRLKLTVLILAVLIAASLPLRSISAAPTVPTVKSAVAFAGCADPTFLAQVTKDFGIIGDFMKQIDSEDASHLVATQLVLAVARQKYEDMTGVPAECALTQQTVIDLFANVSDLLVLKLATFADPPNADTYKKAMTDQSARLGKLVKDFGASLTPAQ